MRNVRKEGEERREQLLVLSERLGVTFHSSTRL